MSCRGSAVEDSRGVSVYMAALACDVLLHRLQHDRHMRVLHALTIHKLLKLRQ